MRGPKPLQIVETLYLHPYGVTHSNRILHDGRTRWEKIFNTVDNNASGLSPIFVTRMLTHDMYAVADLISIVFKCSC